MLSDRIAKPSLASPDHPLLVEAMRQVQAAVATAVPALVTADLQAVGDGRSTSQTFVS